MQRKAIQLILLLMWAAGLLASVGTFLVQTRDFRQHPAEYGFHIEPGDQISATQQLELQIDKVSDKYFDAIAGFFSPWLAVVAALFMVRSRSLRQRLDVGVACAAIGLTLLVQVLVIVLNWFYLSSPAIPDASHYLTKTFVPVITSILGAIATFAFPKEEAG